MRKLRLDGLNIFESVEWLVNHLNLVGIFFGYSNEPRLNGWQKKIKKNRLVICNIYES
jgi:uncharacterized membrane protein